AAGGSSARLRTGGARGGTPSRAGGGGFALLGGASPGGRASSYPAGGSPAPPHPRPSPRGVAPPPRTRAPAQATATPPPGAGRTVLARLEGLAPFSEADSLRRAVEASARAEIAATRELERAYDETSNHGEAQGVRLSGG